MNMYSFKGEYPAGLPYRIRLSNGLTRTNTETFTDEEIIDAGYIKVSDKPSSNVYEHVVWENNNWEIKPFSPEEIEIAIQTQWEKIKRLRTEAINQVEWRIFRHQSELRLGLTPTEDLVVLDSYIQALREITDQSDPFNIIWPSLP